MVVGNTATQDCHTKELSSCLISKYKFPSLHLVLFCPYSQTSRNLPHHKAIISSRILVSTTLLAHTSGLTQAGRSMAGTLQHAEEFDRKSNQNSDRRIKFRDTDTCRVHYLGLSTRELRYYMELRRKYGDEFKQPEGDLIVSYDDFFCLRGYKNRLYAHLENKRFSNLRSELLDRWLGDIPHEYLTNGVCRCFLDDVQGLIEAAVGCSLERLASWINTQ
jgi:hypothetical protein